MENATAPPAVAADTASTAVSAPAVAWMRATPGIWPMPEASSCAMARGAWRRAGHLKYFRLPGGDAGAAAQAGARLVRVLHARGEDERANAAWATKFVA